MEVMNGGCSDVIRALRVVLSIPRHPHTIPEPIVPVVPACSAPHSDCSGFVSPVRFSLCFAISIDPANHIELGTRHRNEGWGGGPFA